MEKSFSFVEGTSRVMIDGVVREVTYNSDWQPIQPEGFTWRTGVYEKTDKTKEDLAVVKILKGGRIPVEINVQSKETDQKHTFWEVHLSGKANLLMQKPREEPQIFSYGYGAEEFPYTVRIEERTVFCIFADPNQEGNVFYYETEIPGYIEDALPRVDVDASEWKGYTITKAFWQKFHEMDTGLKFNPDGIIS